MDTSQISTHHPFNIHSLYPSTSSQLHPHLFFSSLEDQSTMWCSICNQDPCKLSCTKTCLMECWAHRATHLIMAKRETISITALSLGIMALWAIMCTSISFSVLLLSFVAVAPTPIMSTLFTVILIRMGMRILETRISTNPLNWFYPTLFMLTSILQVVKKWRFAYHLETANFLLPIYGSMSLNHQWRDGKWHLLGTHLQM